MAKEASHSRAKSALGGHAHKGKPHSIHVRRGKSGGFIATHHHKAEEGGMTPEPEDHVVPDLNSLQAHMASNMGDQPPAPPSAPTADVTSPPPSPAAAPAGM